MANDKRGGARPNSGPKKGAKYKPTIMKEAARDALRQIVLADMRELVDAQLAQAKGLKYLVTRDRHSGKFIRVTETMAKAKQDADDRETDTIEVWEKDPSIQAFTDLMNRALDKPAEQQQQVEIKGALRMIHELPG